MSVQPQEKSCYIDEFKVIMVSKINQSQKAKCYMIPLIYEMSKVVKIIKIAERKVVIKELGESGGEISVYQVEFQYCKMKRSTEICSKKKKKNILKIIKIENISITIKKTQQSENHLDNCFLKIQMNYSKPSNETEITKIKLPELFKGGKQNSNFKNNIYF